MKTKQLLTVLLVASASVWALPGCDEDRTPLCETEEMQACIEHEHGTCVVEDGQARCECVSSAFYKTAGITCAPILSQCQYGCMAETDCLVNSVDLGYLCIGADDEKPGTCEQCTSDKYCLAKKAGWSPKPGCEKNADCTAGQACIDIGDRGVCATKATINETTQAPECAAGVVYTTKMRHKDTDTDGPGKPFSVCGLAQAEYFKCDLPNPGATELACVATECSDSDKCVAKMAGWLPDTVANPGETGEICTAGGSECAAGYVCVDIGKDFDKALAGRCLKGCVECVKECGEGYQAYQMNTLAENEASVEPVMVCGIQNASNAICSSGFCEDPCDIDQDCSDSDVNPDWNFCDTETDSCFECKKDEDCREGGKCGDDGTCFCVADAFCVTAEEPTMKCDIQSRTCVCGSDDDCDDPGAPKCVGGSCVCENNADCAGVDNTNTCLEGVCVCTGDSAAVCTVDGGFTSGTWTCTE